MLDNIMAMLGMDAEAMNKMKTELITASLDFKNMSVKIDMMQIQIDEMHKMFFSLVPKPQNVVTTENGITLDLNPERLNDANVHVLNTPETAYPLS